MSPLARQLNKPLPAFWVQLCWERAAACTGASPVSPGLAGMESCLLCSSLTEGEAYHFVRVCPIADVHDLFIGGVSIDSSTGVT